MTSSEKPLLASWLVTFVYIIHTFHFYIFTNIIFYIHLYVFESICARMIYTTTCAVD